MPHKHKRKRGGEDIYDLSPSENALPLPVTAGKRNGKQIIEQTRAKRPRKDRNDNNDTPREFRRLMAYAQGKTIRSGLDDGGTEKSTKSALDSPVETPRIKPGENIRSFSARVDAALPISGLATKTKTKDGKDSLGFKVRRTRKERKMHKLYDQWRAEERKIQEQKEDDRELAAEELETQIGSSGTLAENALEGIAQLGDSNKSRKRGKAQEDDPWQQLLRKRGEAKIGLHDVAQAPPDLLHKKFRKQLQVGGAVVDVENIPRAAGSLRRREELQTARDDVLEAYRKIKEHEQAKLDAQRSRRK
ncbi:hypothetical protein E4U22_000875 [Claviceps purpurea]|uniref:Urease accessory protein UreD n=1 Tax=Claviceps purpurea (strain 20.1) TaxID=1111077 RepID=M1W5M3_CLAP2|nr:hypothetical protein E4U38_004781 [Claviceps purpurea]CCE29985.1 uncharacterized protein CPUR_03832 [Claviceps purpurea 20.1]KAG6132521.1 hypothetical protein E4U28_006541 [Claviceps purpurea]KAG6134199.1 hypothetical protein E4U12_002400 [Claviceps purpurea]KAG6154239.1 hypothetical protein E4U37_002280 [Claviceps purpurea]